MLSGRSQRRLAVYRKLNNVSLGVGMSRREQRRGKMSRREQRRGEIGKVSFDVGEGRLRREQQMEMEEMRKRILDMQYRMWYSKGLESSWTLSPDTSDSNVQKQLAHYTSMLLSEDVNLQLHATTQIEKLLSIERECPTILVKNGVVRRFVHFLMRDDCSDLQYEAIWALIKIFCGTCGKTKAESVREAVPCFVRLLDSPSDDVCEQAVFALGVVAYDSHKYRDLVLSNGVLVPLLKQLEKHANLGKNAKLSMLRNVTWTLSILCEDISGSSYKQVKPALTTLERLLHSDDVEVLTNSCWAIHSLSFDVIGRIDPLMDAGLCPMLVKHLLHSSRWVQIPALLTVALIPSVMTHIQALIESGALGHLLTLLTEDPKDEDPKDGDRRIKREACRVITGIVYGNECQIQAVIDAKLFGVLVKLLESPYEDLQKLAGKAFSNATSGGSRKQIEYLVFECKMINPICNLVSSQSPIIVDIGLQVLGNVLDARMTGISSSSDVCPTLNDRYIKLMVEAQCVEKIEKIRRGEVQVKYETMIQATYVLCLLGYNDDFDMPPSSEIDMDVGRY